MKMKGKYVVMFIVFMLLLLMGGGYYLLHQHAAKQVKEKGVTSLNVVAGARLKTYAIAAKKFCIKNGYSTGVCFLVDMKLHSGKKRFFVYDLEKETIINAGLVAHGSCNTLFLVKGRFSNMPDCGCSSIGKYKISYQYNGRFGTAFKLDGLDSTNDNAFKRFIVLHAYGCVPDEETYPVPICNSLGCPMVSYKFLQVLQAVIKKEKKPVLLSMFD